MRLSSSELQLPAGACIIDREGQASQASSTLFVQERERLLLRLAATERPFEQTVALIHNFLESFLWARWTSSRDNRDMPRANLKRIGAGESGQAWDVMAQ